ncbi:hypothetical protein M2165_003789 [Variovorax sp. TBS-050B]|uniref:hypothetical protein n=1 Tax=Variovorax sp. TBS-050B TaxID=2940551 RepID=UPI002475494A|nr:hypothetical protein [Variovorax sp. TBS-050B]MDH6593900.1 hypothetical protein [Variovorax sp. TBS-050B]
MNIQPPVTALFEIEPPGDRLQLNPPLVAALGQAYARFAATGQDPKHFEIHISERKTQEADEDNGENTIEIAFSAKLPRGTKGLGNAGRGGRSIVYIASVSTGEILREYLSR